MSQTVKRMTMIERNWRKRMILSFLFIILIEILLELVWFLMMKSVLGGTSMSFVQYLIRYPVVSALINFTAFALMVKINKSPFYDDKYKNRAICVALMVLCLEVQIVHCDLIVLVIVPIIAIFVTTILMEKALANIEMVIAFISSLIATYRSYRMGYYDSVGDAVQSSICVLFLLIALYLITINIARYEKAQMDTLHEIQQRQSNLMDEMKIDPLTGLFNRKTFDESINVRIANIIDYELRGQGAQYPIMAVLDVDLFKRINDTYGHIHGDEVLMTLSSIMRSNTSGRASAFRYGGEEFVILFDKQSMDSVVEILEDIRIQFSEVRYSFAPGVRVTVSAGVAQLEVGMDGKSWFALADSALYKAKKTGRDKIIVLREM